MTEVEICNVALGRIGVTAYINALSENTTEARACAVSYPQARDTLLEAHPWPFATSRAQLPRLAPSSSDGSRQGFAFVYALPSDCLKAREIWPGMRRVREDQKIPFRVEHRASSRILLTDHPAPELEYTVAITDPTLFPPLFREALIWRLARELSMALAVKPDIAARAEQAAQMALFDAAASADGERQDDPPPESEFIAVRY